MRMFGRAMTQVAGRPDPRGGNDSPQTQPSDATKATDRVIEGIERLVQRVDEELMRYKNAANDAFRLIGHDIKKIHQRLDALEAGTTAPSAEIDGLLPDNVYMTGACFTPGCNWGHGAVFETGTPALRALIGHVHEGHQPVIRTLRR